MTKNSVFLRIGIFFFCFITPVSVLAWDVSVAFTSFENKISSRYDKDIQEAILNRVQKRLLELSYENTLSSITKQKISETQKLLHEARFDRWYNEEFSQIEQKNNEKTLRETLQKQLESKELSQSYRDILSPWREFLAVNNQGEFVKEGSLYKISYSNYFPVNVENMKALQAKNCLIIEVQEGDVRCIENYRFLKKKPYSELSKEFAGLFTSEYKILEKQGYYVWYLFEKYRFYDDAYGVYDTQIETSGFDRSKTFLYIDAQGLFQ